MSLFCLRLKRKWTPHETRSGRGSRRRKKGGNRMTLAVTEDTPPDMLTGQMGLKLKLPHGNQVRMSVNRSTPMMDLLVQVTTTHKLSPASYVLLPYGETGVLPYKPSTPIGALDTWSIHVVPKLQSNNSSSGKSSSKQSSQPFEQTFRIQVHLPRKQLYVTRVSGKTTLGQVLKQVCEDKNLDQNKYSFRHPRQLDQPLNEDVTMGDFKHNQLCLVSNNALPTPVSSEDILAMQQYYPSRESSSRSMSPDSSMSPQPPQPNRPTRKRKPAPKPPSQSQEEPQQSNKKNESSGTVISHSRTSSDSSGYHEASVLSESPDSNNSLPDSLPRRSKLPGREGEISRSLGDLSGPPKPIKMAQSTSALHQGRKKKPAPAPPLVKMSSVAEEVRNGCSSASSCVDGNEASSSQVIAPSEEAGEEGELLQELPGEKDEEKGAFPEATMVEEVVLRKPPQPKPRTSLSLTGLNRKSLVSVDEFKEIEEDNGGGISVKDGEEEVVVVEDEKITRVVEAVTDEPVSDREENEPTIISGSPKREDEEASEPDVTPGTPEDHQRENGGGITSSCLESKDSPDDSGLSPSAFQSGSPKPSLRTRRSENDLVREAEVKRGETSLESMRPVESTGDLVRLASTLQEASRLTTKWPSIEDLTEENELIMADEEIDRIFNSATGGEGDDDEGDLESRDATPPTMKAPLPSPPPPVPQDPLDWEYRLPAPPTFRDEPIERVALLTELKEAVVKKATLPRPSSPQQVNVRSSWTVDSNLSNFTIGPYNPGGPLRKTTSELSIINMASTDVKDSITNESDERILDKKDVEKTVTGLQSLHILKTILPQISQSQGSVNTVGLASSSSNENISRPAVVKSSRPVSISVTTWGERPKRNVSIKSDRDYVFGKGQAEPHLRRGGIPASSSAHSIGQMNTSVQHQPSVNGQTHRPKEFVRQMTEGNIKPSVTFNFKRQQSLNECNDNNNISESIGEKSNFLNGYQEGPPVVPEKSITGKDESTEFKTPLPPHNYSIGIVQQQKGENIIRRTKIQPTVRRESSMNSDIMRVIGHRERIEDSIQMKRASQGFTNSQSSVQRESSLRLVQEAGKASGGSNAVVNRRGQSIYRELDTGNTRPLKSRGDLSRVPIITGVELKTSGSPPPPQQPPAPKPTYLFGTQAELPKTKKYTSVIGITSPSSQVIQVRNHPSGESPTSPQPPMPPPQPPIQSPTSPRTHFPILEGVAQSLSPPSNRGRIQVKGRKFQPPEDPREELLESIRAFGGKGNLRKVSSR